MKIDKLKWATLCLAAAMALGGCDIADDPGVDPTGSNGRLKVEITDAPIDEASVKGVFVTVTEVQVNGQKWEGFRGPKTVNVLELQGGKTASLGEGNLSAGSFDKLTLVLDHEKDASGNAPGCYILRENNSKNKLSLSGNATSSIDIAGPRVEVPEGGSKEVVVDFDLRKAIKEQASASNEYAFVTKGELQSSLRFVQKENAGSIKGKLNSYNASTNGKAIAYVYKKGTFNQNTELRGQGDSQIKFKNAVTSAKVNADGTFTAAFLPEGEYELHVATYRQESSGNLTLNALLNLGGGASVNSISVKANTQTSLTLSVTGILGDLL
jgi:hypothetical protein